MDVLAIYKQTKGLLEGHFLLRSGRHSPKFLQSCTVLQHPLYAEAIGEKLAGLFEEVDVDVVVGPAIGGVVLSFVTAKAIGARGIFAEKDLQGGMTFRPGLELNPGEHFLAVEDVVTTGDSVRKAIHAAEARGGICVGVGAIVDRSDGKAHFGLPFKSLLSLDFPTYQAEECPFCQAGVPLEEV